MFRFFKICIQRKGNMKMKSERYEKMRDDWRIAGFLFGSTSNRYYKPWELFQVFAASKLKAKPDVQSTIKPDTLLQIKSAKAKISLDQNRINSSQRFSDSRPSRFLVLLCEKNIQLNVRNPLMSGREEIKSRRSHFVFYWKCGLGYQVSSCKIIVQ